MSTVFKIRRSDGQFSMGGSSPSFNKTGKIWKQKGHLTNHLNQLWSGYRRYRDCEIVVMELVETHTDTITLEEWMNEVLDRKQKKVEAWKKHSDDRDKKARKKQFEKLQKEFG